jgi:flagellar biosynthesis protein FliQ
MASKQISAGVGIPMIITGVILAFFLAPIQADLKDTIEFLGSLIGILGVIIFIAGLFSRKTLQITSS